MPEWRQIWTKRLQRSLAGEWGRGHQSVFIKRPPDIPPPPANTLGPVHSGTTSSQRETNCPYTSSMWRNLEEKRRALAFSHLFRSASDLDIFLNSAYVSSYLPLDPKFVLTQNYMSAFKTVTQVNENKGKEKRNSPTIIKDHPPPWWLETTVWQKYLAAKSEVVQVSNSTQTKVRMNVGAVIQAFKKWMCSL